MDLMHNQVFRITSGPDSGLYRVILDEIRASRTCVVRLDPPATTDRQRRGRKMKPQTKRPRKKTPAPLIGTLIWMARVELEQLSAAHQLLIVEMEPENINLSPKDITLYERRKEIMSDFLNLDTLMEQILIHQGIGNMVRIAMENTGASASVVWKLFSELCRLGFTESSLKPRRDRCGAPGIPRPCDPEGRQKSGAKTTKQRIAKAHGIILPPEQPGMNTRWREMIMTADAGIPTPKPSMPDRCNRIVASAFVTRYRQENGELIPIDPKLGGYPNRGQIRRVLEVDIPRLQRILEKTTKSHFKSSLRGLIGRAWQGVAGPGHTWAIDSTVGDIYLRSSVNRAWIVGRPIVYIIVDVWSTAIVGFFVCLTGPSWDMAKISLFCSAADPMMIADLWGYVPILSLNPAPTMCAALMCDRGEYLSKAAKQTGADLIPCGSYAPPYRPDFKGSVEVPHRIEKDKQYIFVPGAIDHRREEYELRRFNTDEAVLTVRDYTQLLYTIFTEYNLAANRENRCDAHMKAAGVYPSPAGLWRWGHEMGIGVRRAIPQAELITSLLPKSEARVTRSGVMFGGQLYESDVVNEQQWSTHARNVGGWDIAVHSFPGSMSRIWTPNVGGHGLLELRLSDFANASPELTADDVADAFAFAKAGRAENQHARVLQALQSIRRMEEIVANAKRHTAEALAHTSGPTPTMRESRMIETMISQQPPAYTESTPVVHNGDAMDSHLEMMQSLLAATNYAEDQNG